MRRASPVVGVAAIGFIAVGIFAVVRASRVVLTVLLLAVGALLTIRLQARERLSSYANPVSDPFRRQLVLQGQSRHTGAYLIPFTTLLPTLTAFPTIS